MQKTTNYGLNKPDSEDFYDVEHFNDNMDVIDKELKETNTKIDDVVTTSNGHIENKSNPHSVTKSQIGLGKVDNKSSETIRGELTSGNVTKALGYTPINQSLKGVASGIAELDASGKVPSSQLPSFVDDVLEYTIKSSFPTTGETGKIYVDVSTNLSYRWGGSAYVEISPSLALGETSSTAYRGDKGKVAYEHSQKTSGNPHGVTKSDVGLGNVNNTSDANKPISTATQKALDELQSDVSANSEAISDILENQPVLVELIDFTDGEVHYVKIGKLVYVYGVVTTNGAGVTICRMPDELIPETSQYGVFWLHSGTDNSNGNVAMYGKNATNPGTLIVRHTHGAAIETDCGAYLNFMYYID